MKMRTFFAASIVLVFAGAAAYYAAAEEAADQNLARYNSDLAQVHMKYKQYDKAEECLKKAIELEQDTIVSSDYAYQLAKLYIECGRTDEAETMFEFCLEMTPDVSSMVNRGRELARVYEKAEKYDQAETVYKKLIDKADGPLGNMLRREYYRMCLKAGKLQEVIAEKEKQAKDAPENEELLADLAYMYRLTNDDTSELSTYKKLVQINPDDQKSLYQLAIAYRQAGEYEKAVDNYQRLLEVNPVARPYYITEIVKIYNSAGKQDKANEWAKKLVTDEDKNTPAGHARLARLYTELGKHVLAVQEYQAAVAASEEPRQKEHYQLQLARLHQTAKEYADAKDIAENLIKSDNKFVKREAQVILAQARKALGSTEGTKEIQREK